MKAIGDLEFGFADAENYKRRENRDLLNRIFIRGASLDRLIQDNISFLIGEKGTGKTAYSVYLSNNNYKNNLAAIRYIRETEYAKFVELKRAKHLTLSDYKSIWKVLLMMLMAHQVKDREGVTSKVMNYPLFHAVDSAIDEFYQSAFTPEIVQAMQFVEESGQSAEILAKYFKISGNEKSTSSFSESRFQVNLLYIQKKFEQALSQIRLGNSHIIFIDGIDIRPSTIPYEEYLECIKGLANAVWELNNDFFPTIKGGQGRMRVVMLVRPDIFDTLGLQNQNTKIRDNSVYLDWRSEYANHRSSDIFQVTDRLLSSQQGSEGERSEGCELQLGEAWDNYFPWNATNVIDDYSHPSSFIAFMRWSYYRPRDIVVMLDLLKANAGDGRKGSFSIDDFENPSFGRDYSNYLLGELKDHLSFYYSPDDYNAFLKFFEFMGGADKFTYDTYLQAFDRFKSHLGTTGREEPIFTQSPTVFLQFLFELNAICYIERTVDGRPFIHWCFKDRSYANISPKVKTGLTYQVFYGLAKALNLGKQFTGSA
ncbi:P-loop ATPase, Sll1717 family [Stenotrophomonas maltophilia]|uniref:P-loop ATPase, Sll1717 family n=1 Tax=Stenotrophomonas maltophilia TaxID=40324 RepID=UPI000C16076B|nr:funZ protein [Stenotrophomonas maltophilia]